MNTSLSRTFAATVAACTLALLAACAVVHAPVDFVALDTAAPAQPQRLASAVTIEFDTGYRRTIKAASQWKLVGSVAQGEVFKPVNDVFALEGAHMHEAYLVVHQGSVVGFYLPAERSFSSLRQQIPFSFSRTP